MINDNSELSSAFPEESKSKIVNEIYLIENKNISENSFEKTKDFFYNHLINKIDSLHNKKKVIYENENKIIFDKLYHTVNLGDIPLSHIYNSLFNQEKKTQELNIEKSFLLSLMESEQDHNISFENTELKSEKKPIETFLT